eukprot:359071-Chlamydomonas_euryale.AAC.11
MRMCGDAQPGWFGAACRRRKCGAGNGARLPKATVHWVVWAAAEGGSVERGMAPVCPMLLLADTPVPICPWLAC